jgi:hypothetical protein
MSVLITENSNIIEISTSINSLAASSPSKNNVLTQSNDTNVSIFTTPNNINVNNIVIRSSNITSSDITDLDETISDILEVSTITYPQLSDSVIESLNIQNRIAKAWINFNGSGLVSIRDDFNINNIIDNGVGDYTINFSSSFANTNYTFVAWARDFNSDVYVTSMLGAKSNTPKTTTSIRVIFNYLLNGFNYDSSECNLIFFSS